MITGLSNFFRGSQRKNIYYKNKEQKNSEEEKKPPPKEEFVDITNEVIPFLDKPPQIELKELKPLNTTTETNKEYLTILFESNAKTQHTRSILEELTEDRILLYDDKKLHDVIKLMIHATITPNPISLSEELLYTCKKILSLPKISPQNIRYITKAIIHIAIQNEHNIKAMKQLMSPTLRKRFQGIRNDVCQYLNYELRTSRIKTHLSRKELRLILMLSNQLSKDCDKESFPLVLKNIKEIIALAKEKKEGPLLLEIKDTVERIKENYKKKPLPQ